MRQHRKKPYTDYANNAFKIYFRNPKWLLELKQQQQKAGNPEIRVNASHISDPTAAQVLANESFCIRHAAEIRDYNATVEAIKRIKQSQSGDIKLKVLKYVYGGHYKTVTGAIRAVSLDCYISEICAWKYLSQCCVIWAECRGLTLTNYEDM